jgi:hypothetical protein
MVSTRTASAGNHRVQAQNFTGSAIRIIKVLPSREAVESLARPWQRMKIPHGLCPSTRTTACSGENRGMFYLVERFDGLLGEIAEETAGTQIAIQTAFNAVQSGHTHWRSSISHKNTFAPVLAGND